MSGPEPLVRVGDVLRLGDGDYLRGGGPYPLLDGPIRLRVTYLPRGAEAYAGDWLALLGVEIQPDGSDGRHRVLSVRTAALPGRRARRPEPSRGSEAR